jgi:hypothetical protein
MEILIACALAYLLVSPDKMSLALSRGMFGASRGALTGRTPKTADAAKPSPRGRAMSAGWREGVAAARERREAGRDLWTRGTRFAGHVGGGTASLARGINSTIQARRGQAGDTELDGGTSPDAVPSRRGWTVPHLVRRPRTAATSDASVAVVDEAGNDVTGTCGRCGKPALVDSTTGATYRICLDCWEKENGDTTEAVPTPLGGDTQGSPTPGSDNTGATVTEPQTKPTDLTPSQPPAINPANPSQPATNGVIVMPNQSELSTVDELANEMKTMENVFADLSEAIAKAKKWGANLPDRWAAANWGTKGLDRAVMDLSEEIAGIKLVPLESFAGARSEIGKARTLGETADAIQARGKTEAFRPN